jgi:NAD(P)-dependent dehydrogenase (short-subunit alcohol dehydrogenase family)
MEDPEMSRQHDVAIVTGGGRGIGQSTATALAAEGLAVAAVARSEAAVERTAAEIQARDGRAAAIVGDVTDEQSVEEIVAAAERQLGGSCGILVNAAGTTGPVGEIAELDVDEWRATLDVNLTGAFAMSRAVLPAMKARGSGRIVNVISGLAHRPQPGLGAYCASKAGLLHLTRVIDAETRGSGVRAFAVEPGLVRTEMSESLLSLEPSGVRASVIGMLNQLEADPGFVEAEESAQFIRLVATGQADDLAGEACSIYDPSVRSRLPATASDR